ncbi:LysR family transcriptional regulator [Bradyrhizobium brasilense]|uniref:LysR family transcriptional regulator n=1 Tax=Bradyrhizobium brasilense TaxID=1419277 RepID=UPI0028775FFD|nr:LysR family transcriptional regulator [Bradyrhizobium brasilense]MCP3420082.1 LysR family transcriptional regulator [Bradyrhizobium brasilense]
MAKASNWEARIGRRIRLHDLHAFATVVQSGSISKAAVTLGVTQSAISQMVADLEATLQVRLLDRSTRGVASTVFGDVLLRRSRAALDELRHGMEEISFLSNQTTGEVRVGCPESISSAVLPRIANLFFRQYPRAVLDVEHINLGRLSLLLDRKIDLVIARGNRSFGAPEIPDEVDVRTLFEDELVVAAGPNNRWFNRRKIELADIVHERWILTEPGIWNHSVVTEAFAAQGLEVPNISMRTLSVHMRTQLIATGDFITTLPRSVLHLYAERYSLKALPVDLPARPWPVSIITLKNRSLSPIVHRFIRCAEDVAKEMDARPRLRQSR